MKGEPLKNFNILERMELYNVPGLSMALVEDGKIKWAKGYGIANETSGLRVDENTIFQAGSISKPVAALAALKLAQDGKLYMDDPNNDQHNVLTPMEEMKFLDIEKGDEIIFEEENESLSLLWNHRFRFHKMKP